MKLFLRFMYNGEVHIGQEQLPDFLKTAQLLQVRGLADVANPARLSSTTLHPTPLPVTQELKVSFVSLLLLNRSEQFLLLDSPPIQCPTGTSKMTIQRQIPHHRSEQRAQSYLRSSMALVRNVSYQRSIRHCSSTR